MRIGGNHISIPPSKDWVKTERTITVKPVSWNYCQIYNTSRGTVLLDDFMFKSQESPRKDIR